MLTLAEAGPHRRSRLGHFQSLLFITCFFTLLLRVFCTDPCVPMKVVAFSLLHLLASPAEGILHLVFARRLF